MKKVICLSIFMFSFFSFCLADSLPISDIIKEARENSVSNQTTKTVPIDDNSTKTSPDNSKQEIKDNVSSTLEEINKSN